MTTGHTPNLNLPYPEGDEYVIGGDDAIQALAESVDAALVASYFESTLATGSAAYVHAGGVQVVTLNGPLANTADFTYDAGLITYTGPTRPFVITAAASLHLGDGAFGSLTLEVGGIARRVVESFAGTDNAGWLASELSWAGPMPAGTTIRLVAQAPASTEVWYPAVAIAACGPVWG